MKFLVDVNNELVLLNTKHAKMLCRSKGRGPLYRYYKQAEYYFRTIWWPGFSVEIGVFLDLNSFIIDITKCVGIETAIKLFNLKEPQEAVCEDVIEIEKVRQRNISIGEAL